MGTGTAMVHATVHDTVLLIQPTCMLVIGAYGDDDDCDRDEPKHHAYNFFFEGDDTNSLCPIRLWVG